MRPIMHRPQDLPVFDDPDVPLGPRGPLLAPPGPTPGWPPAPSLARDRERVRTRDTPRERLHPRSAQPEPQLVPVPMSDGDDDQPPQEN